MTSTVTDVTTSPRIITVAAFKGGVGKTTTTANIAASIAEANPDLHGLVIDLDPQTNLGDSFEYLVDSWGPADTADLLRNALHDPTVRLNPADTTRLDLPNGRLDLLPSDESLTSVQDQAVTQPGGEGVLRRLLKDTTYDFILIDTPPSDGRLTLNAVCASTHVVAVVNPARWSASGVARVEAFVQRARDYGLSDAQFIGSIVNKVEGGKRVGRDAVLGDLEATETVLLEPFVPLRTAATDSELLGHPVVLESPKSDVGKAYRKLAKRIWQESGPAARGVA